MSINNSIRAVAATELIATMTGSNVLIGTLIAPPVILIFDNQGSASVVISIDNIQWKTFPAGEALVLDMRGNHGMAANFTFDEGTQIFGNGASGNFSVSYLYARNS
ncbi:MAG TPA: hypothetical protein VGK47_14805 [Nitrososphaeraceae archaeon]